MDNAVRETAVRRAAQFGEQHGYYRSFVMYDGIVRSCLNAAYSADIPL
jgi:hypothetical protein